MNDDIVSVYIPGNIDYYDSYGLIGSQLIRHLSRQNYHVNAISMGLNIHPNQPEDIRELVRKPIQPIFGGILLGYPSGYVNYGPMASHGPRIAITMFESTKLPSDWVDVLNGLDAVIVPSWFCSDVFTSCGVTAPIHVIPLGVEEIYTNESRRVPQNKEQYHVFASGFKPSYRLKNDEAFDFTPIQLYRKGEDLDAVRLLPRPFTFLTFYDRGPRKGGDTAKDAFLTAFGDDENFHLVIKERYGHMQLNPTNPNITHIRADMNERELLGLYLSVDCLINPHKGEGFGLIPREFAATGGIALTTHWSGTVDGINEWGVPLRCKLVDADWSFQPKFEGMDLGQWADVSVDDCARAMRAVWNQRDFHYRLSRYRARNIQRLYSWSNFAREVLSVWEGVVHGNLN